MRFWIIVATLVAGALCLAPTLLGEMPAWWTKVVPVQRLRLGLDLKGGVHLVLGVEIDKAVENATERVANELRDTFRRKRLGVGTVRREGLTTIVLVPSPESSRDKIRVELDEYPTFQIDKDAADEIRLTMRSAEVDRIRTFAVDQGLETIRNRIDQFGVSETTVVKQGTNRILVELPGVSDPRRAIELIGKTALLEFKLLDETNSLEEALKGNVPPGSQILYQQDKDPSTGRTSRTPYLVQKRVILTGTDLNDAKVDLSGSSGKGPAVSMSFNNRGARTFALVTEENVGKRLAIVLDDNVYSAPVIQEKITGGRAQITGRFTVEEATDLAIVLRAGSLPAPVEILENRSVGPSLGADLIRKGIISTVVGCLLVMVFMAIYYGLSGLVADFALLVNLTLLLASLAALRASLTMPGIAGIVLTLGIAVDANVLIFERIREELRGGRAIRAAIETGYARAFVTILDTHVTAMLTAVVLYFAGSGPVKGFGVTLFVGLAISLFTAVVVTRVIFDWVTMTRKITKLSI
ncbi:MAG TPA: protein translocase subunit SecD [bacterium]